MSGVSRQARRTIAETFRSVSRAESSSIDSTPLIVSIISVQVFAEDGLEQLVLRVEVVVEEPMRDACLLGDVAYAARVVALAGKHTDRSVQDELPLVLWHGGSS